MGHRQWSSPTMARSLHPTYLVSLPKNGISIINLRLHFLSNPTERSNCVIKTLIRQYITDNHKHWDKYIGEFRLAINSAIHDSTGYSPAFLNFGRELRLPASIHKYPIIEGREEDASPSTEDRTDRFRKIYESVRRNLMQAYNRQARYYNLRRRPTNLKAGQQVWCRQHELSDASKFFSAKLAPKFNGPYTITKSMGANNFELISDSGQIARAHAKDLKPYLT